MKQFVVNKKIAECRKDFPILKLKIHGNPLVYLDNAATTQKPLAVIEALDTYRTRRVPLPALPTAVRTALTITASCMIRSLLGRT